MRKVVSHCREAFTVDVILCGGDHSGGDHGALELHVRREDEGADTKTEHVRWTTKDFSGIPSRCGCMVDVCSMGQLKISSAQLSSPLPVLHSGLFWTSILCIRLSPRSACLSRTSSSTAVTHYSTSPGT